MPRFVMKFAKEGYTKYISHLDLLRVFKRAFKVTGIDLKYSNGYNPHPKMGFAQPLSLGYSSIAEYLEFETITDHIADELNEKLSSALPKDVRVLDLKAFESEASSLAAETVACRYLISFHTDKNETELKEDLSSYLAQPVIKAMKRMKKTKSLEEVNIKEKIRMMDISLDDENAVIDCLLDSGSQSNLSPELVIQSLLDYTHYPIKRWEIEVERIEILYSNRIQFQHIDKTP